MSGSNRGDNKILIEWPDSQRIMAHPDAELSLDHPSAYWIPKHIWERYATSYYEEEEE